MIKPPSFFMGWVVGFLFCLAPCSFWLGKLSVLKDTIEWQSTAKACVMNSEALQKHIKSLLSSNDEFNKMINTNIYSKKKG